MAKALNNTKFRGSGKSRGRELSTEVGAGCHADALKTYY